MIILIASIIVVVIIYFILIYPGISNKSRIHAFDQIYAHRGLFENGSLCPENSLAAFRKAVDAGYGVELDVHVTKDNQVVVFHDDDLARMCGSKLKIEECTYDEIRKYHLLETDERIPLLSDVLKVVSDKVPLIIEIKVLNHVKDRCRIISTEIEKFNCKYCVESFNPFVLVWYKKNKPSVIRGQLSTDYYKDNVEGNVLKNFALKNLLFNFLTKPDFIAYNHVYKQSLSFIIVTRIMHALPVAWTIRNQKEMDDAKNIFAVFIFEGFIPDQK